MQYGHCLWVILLIVLLRRYRRELIKCCISMDSKKAILATLVYSDIFNYPLTEDEMWKYLITSEKVGFCKESLEKTLKQLSTKITKQNNFYCLTGREEIVTQRLSKEIINQKKLVIAKRIARILNFIPTVQLIGLSGGLAMENADVTDDIDFFVITKKNTLWMTRFCLLILLAILGKRREHNKQEKKDSVCINMLVDEQSLQLPSKRQDLYTARSEEHTSELQSPDHLVCRLLLENKKH